LWLLENKVAELGIVDRASASTIGRALEKKLFSPIAGSTGSSRRRPTARRLSAGLPRRDLETTHCRNARADLDESGTPGPFRL
jgi:hypothetical protein